MADENAETVDKKRSARTTKKQISLIIGYLETHQFMLETKAEPQMLPRIRAAWEELSSLLNTDGPKKTVAQWKSVISELKTNVKRKARKIYVDQQKTGGGPPPKPLTELDEKLYALLAKVSVEGSKEVVEIGFEDATPQLIPEPVVDEEHNENPPEVNEIDNNAQMTQMQEPTRNANKARRTRRSRSTLNNTLQDSVHEQSLALEQLAKSITLLAESIETLSDAIFNLNVK